MSNCNVNVKVKFLLAQFQYNWLDSVRYIETEHDCCSLVNTVGKLSLARPILVHPKFGKK